MKSRRGAEEMNLDFLLDTLTNVVGILILILVLNTLDIKQAVERIRKLDPSQFGITVEQLTEIEQQQQETRTEVAELATQAFGVDVVLDENRRELQQLQLQLVELRRTMPERPPEDPAKEIRQVVQTQEKTVQQLEQQLEKIEAEVEQMQARVEDKPEMKVPAPKVVSLPNPRAAPEGAQVVMFLCQGGELMYFAPDQLRDRAQKRVQYLMRPMLAKAGPGGAIDCQQLVDNYNRDPLSDGDFRTRLVVQNYNLVLFYEYQGSGETPERFRNFNSRYQSVLRKMHPEKNYARFLVWPDSFDVYVEARSLCDQRGILAGWEPYSENYEWRTSLGLKVECEGKPKPEPAKPGPAKPAPGPPPPPLPNDTID
jgi:hypothetical protein